MADDIVKICQNRGCGKKYRAIDNNDEACCFHPDLPSFRDLLKLWPCCNQKSRNFSDFMNIPGCKKSPHSDVVVLPPTPEPSEIIPDKETSTIIRPIIIREYQEDQSSLIPLAITPNEDLLKELSKIVSSENVNENGHGRSSEITIGTKCFNNGCDRKFIVSDAEYQACLYHPGSPVFHEGSKYWSCCRKKTSDFDEFIKQPGCETGKHKWRPSLEESLKSDACRYDYFAMGDLISINIFAKLIHYNESSVLANKTKLSISILYGRYKKPFELTLKLYEEINPERVTIEVTPYKMTISFPKTSKEPWPRLER